MSSPQYQIVTSVLNFKTSKRYDFVRMIYERVVFGLIKDLTNGINGLRFWGVQPRE